ncbi:MAG: lipoyl(octanoyl) transferase LipB [Bacillaceae bacterium]|nr:lipoyl(octanoyl) transferase LipB [Bacillaceae bacterium]
MSRKLDIYMLGRMPYHPTWDLQKAWVDEIDRGIRHDSLLLLEHPHTYTLGRSGKKEHLLIDEEQLKQAGITLAYIDRGGDITYHGPGQVVGYPLMFLGEKGDPHQYLRDLEQVLIDTLLAYGIQSERKEPYTGVWVGNVKIAAIGVKFNRGLQSKGFVTSHGFALNVNTDLTLFQKIIPCGIREYGVTSMAQLLGKQLDIREVMQTISDILPRHFNREPVFKQQDGDELLTHFTEER